ncbi:MAG: serine/threonine-protein kinase [Myxococcota bacterium]
MGEVLENGDDVSASSEHASLGRDLPADEARTLRKRWGARYVPLELLGSGGMGKVYAAYDRTLRRDVAVKALRNPGSVGSERLQREAYAMASVSHPNVVSVYDVITNGEQVVAVVMELVQGTTALEWQVVGGRSWKEIVQLYLGAGQGLIAVHERGLLHRDFKPANVLVSNGRPQVTDFGLVKAQSSGSESTDVLEDDAASPDDRITEFGMVVGTPRYMALEQHRGGTLCEATDQFAFCVALWEALRGRAPFALPRLARKKAAGPPEWGDEVAPRLGRILRRGLAPFPEDRWPSMGALLAELAGELERTHRRRRMLAVVGVSAACALAAGGAATAAAAPEPCDATRMATLGVWDEDVAQRTQHEIAAASSLTDETAVQSVALLDRYASAWNEQWLARCNASPPGDVDVGPCLENALRQFQGTTAVLRRVDEKSSLRVPAAVGQLPALEQCELSDSVPAPALEQTRAATVLDVVAEAAAYRRLGDYDAASERLRFARNLSADLVADDVHARLSLEEVWLADMRRDYATFQEKAPRLLEAVAKTRDWSLLGDAATNLVMLRANPQFAAEAESYFALAQGIHPEGSLGLVRAQNVMGVALAASGDLDRALSLHSHALRIIDETPFNGYWRAGLLNNASITYEAAGRHLDALRLLQDAEALLQKSAGRRHPSTILVGANIAEMHLALGDYASARLEALEAISAFAEHVDPGHPALPTPRRTLALASAYLGDVDVARTALARACSQLSAGELGLTGRAGLELVIASLVLSMDFGEPLDGSIELDRIRARNLEMHGAGDPMLLLFDLHAAEASGSSTEPLLDRAQNLSPASQIRRKVELAYAFELLAENPEAARALFEELATATEDVPSSATAFVGLAHAYLRLGNRERAQTAVGSGLDAAEGTLAASHERVVELERMATILTGQAALEPGRGTLPVPRRVARRLADFEMAL